MTLDRDTIVVRLGLMNDLLSDLETIGGVDAATAFRPDGTPSPGLEREDLRTRAWTWPLSFKFAYWTSWRACGPPFGLPLQIPVSRLAIPPRRPLQRVHLAAEQLEPQCPGVIARLLGVLGTGDG